MRTDQLLYKAHALRHRIERARIAREVEKEYQEVLATWDQAAFVERFRQYWNPFPTNESYKFLDLNTWFREAIHRYHITGLAQMPGGRRVFDIGCGAGYFLTVAKYHGHQTLGLDIDIDPMYNDMIDFLKVPRVVQRIEPLQALTPQWEGTFDLITAFMTCFNERPDGSYWGRDEWMFFLRDLRKHLSRGGKMVVRFNRDPKTGLCYTDDTRTAILIEPGWSARFFLDYLFLTAV